MVTNGRTCLDGHAAHRSVPNSELGCLLHKNVKSSIRQQIEKVCKWVFQ